MKVKAYYSNANWSKTGHSYDKHMLFEDSSKNLDSAFEICKSLKNNYGHHMPPCEIRGTCLETWVTDEKGNKVKENKNAR